MTYKIRQSIPNTYDDLRYHGLQDYSVIIRIFACKRQSEVRNDL